MATIPPAYFLKLSKDKQVEHAIKEKAKHEQAAEQWKKVIQQIYAGQIPASIINNDDDELHLINLK